MINDQNVFLKFLNESGYTSTMSKYFNEFVIFSLSANTLYIINSSAQHVTPIPLNFIEQLNKNELSSKKKTNLHMSTKNSFVSPVVGPCKDAWVCMEPSFVGAGFPFLTRVSHKEITTGDHLISCATCMKTAVYVCTGKPASESTPCAQT